ncbi:MAG: hypothetical protein AAB675_00075 [Patescibacteria group bacterium]
MKKSTFFIYATYIFTKTLAGLTFHPYKSVIETVRRPILLPVILTPFIGIVILFIAGKIASLLIVVYGLKREFIAMFLSTTLVSIIFWQALLIYILISFVLASQKKSS